LVSLSLFPPKIQTAGKVIFRADIWLPASCLSGASLFPPCFHLAKENPSSPPCRTWHKSGFQGQSVSRLFQGYFKLVLESGQCDFPPYSKVELKSTLFQGQPVSRLFQGCLELVLGDASVISQLIPRLN
jgi:hypothetical protein